MTTSLPPMEFSIMVSQTKQCFRKARSAPFFLLMKSILLFNVFVILTNLALAQQQTLRPNPIHDQNTGIIRELTVQPMEPVSAVYLTDEWVSGDFILTPDHVFEDYMIRYDVKNNLLEIKTEKEVKIAPLAKIKQFSFNTAPSTHVYKNSSESKLTGITGLVEELVVGTYSLYVKSYVERIPADYNVATDSGSRIDRFELAEMLLLSNQSGYMDITKAGRRLPKFFGDYYDEIEDYSKKNKLSYKDKEDIARIVAYYNSLTAQQQTP